MFLTKFQNLPLIKDAQINIPGDSDDYKLSLLPFTINLLFAIICRIKTISKLVTEIKSSPVAEALELVKASKSMYSEAFRRYDSSILRNIFYQLLRTLNFLNIPEINHLGRILLVQSNNLGFSWHDICLKFIFTILSISQKRLDKPNHP